MSRVGYLYALLASAGVDPGLKHRPPTIIAWAGYHRNAYLSGVERSLEFLGSLRARLC